MAVLIASLSSEEDLRPDVDVEARTPNKPFLVFLFVIFASDPDSELRDELQDVQRLHQAYNRERGLEAEALGVDSWMRRVDLMNMFP